MKLKRYKELRKFGKTTEPEGSEGRTNGPLRFVVHMHAATKLHYDFRIEMEGVFRSWAVPKGPSLDPLERRLAVKVEDHPLEYGSFEGVIPKGNYGAGTVMIWDEGTYTARASDDREAGEKALLDGFAKGHITFVVKGSKINGEYALIKLAKGEENAWLLLKKGDTFARRSEVTNEDRSARSGRTLGEIARDAETTLLRQGSSAQVQRSAVASAPVKRRRYSKMKAKAAVKAAPSEESPPRRLIPAKPTPAAGAFDRKDWIFERFWDGYRALADAASGRVQLTSRLGTAFKVDFPGIHAALVALPERVVLDGVIVGVDARGKPRRKGSATTDDTAGGARHVFHAFDILHFAGKNLRGLPLRTRKEILGALIPEGDALRINDFVENDGLTF